MNYHAITENNFNEWLAMGLALWPRHQKEELEKEFRNILASKNNKVIIGEDKNGHAVAFINLSLRFEYVQGVSSSPVAYVEGIYVKPEYREQGIARELIMMAETWAKGKNCQELGSDAELTNVDSQKFHEKLGFSKIKTIVHYLKKVK